MIIIFECYNFPTTLAMPEAFSLHNQNLDQQRVSVVRSSAQSKHDRAMQRFYFARTTRANLPASIQKFFGNLKQMLKKRFNLSDLHPELRLH